MKRIALISVVLLLCLGACASGGSGGTALKQPLQYWYSDNWKPGQ